MRRAVTALAACALLLGSCAGIQSTLDPAGDQAAHTQDIWRLMLWVCGGMYALVLIFLASAIWRSRRALTGPPVAEGSESAAELPLQKALTAWGVLIVVGLLALSVGSFLVDRQLALASTKDALHIKVTAAQWWWRVEYQDPVANQQLTTANELYLPAGRPAIVELVSEDVIHSFWIPNLAGKQDLIPGRTNRLVLTPRRVGVYRGQCAEFCGLQHAQMALDATVQSPEAFETWRRSQLQPATPPTAPDQLRGEQLFMARGCAGCHQIQGSDAAGQSGPDLTHLASRRTLAAGALEMNRRDLITWLHDPQAVKPGNHMPIVPLSKPDLDSLAAYLGGLK
jgi:cytochrome c oxidase subunit 2